MAQLSEESIKNLIKLCRIDCTEEESKNLLEHLKRVLDYAAQLQEVDTQDIEPCHHVNNYSTNAWREDEIGKLLPRETFLSNAPDHVGGMIRVPPVLKQTP